MNPFRVEKDGDKMRFVAILLYAAVLLMLIHTNFKAKEREGRLAKQVRSVLVTAMLITFSYLLLLFSNNYIFSSIWYSIYFMSMDWLCFALLEYALIYIDPSKHFPKTRLATVLILSVDSVSIALNVKFGHIFHYKATRWDGKIWLAVTGTQLFNVHLAICYFLLGLCFFELLRAAYRSPKLYRAKYENVVIGLLVVVFVNAFFVYTSLIVDLSVLTYGFAGIIFYNYTFEYLPKILAVRASSVMVHFYSDPILVFDMDGACITANQIAVKRFSVGEKSSYGNQENVLSEFCEQYKICKKEELNKKFTKEKKIKTKQGAIFYRIEYNILRDKKKQEIGYYFLLHDMTEEITARNREWYLMTHDRLTGLYNREYFYEQTKKMLEAHPDTEFVIICSNIGQFKLVNEFFDVEFGNNILKNIADTMRKNATEKSVYGRLGSDRFAICIPAKLYDERWFLDDTGKIEVKDIHNFTFVNYFGVYFIKNRDMSVGAMCDRAITAIESIKGDYNKNVAYYNKEIHEEYMREQKLIADFDEAIEAEEFEIYIQPQTSLTTGRCESGEVLVRWCHGEDGMISPGVFIPVFEKNGMVARLDRYIWEKACQVLNRWEKEGKGEMSLSVNISPRDFYYMDIAKEFSKLIQKYQINPAKLNLELTESAFVREQEQMLELLERLQSLGFSIEMDDFGSGYSSLNTLKDIPVDVLKIDMGFFSDTDAKSRSRKIVEMVVQLGKSLGIAVIAEGVEKEETVTFLKEVGCDMIQGYFFAAPMPVDTFESRYFSE